MKKLQEIHADHFKRQMASAHVKVTNNIMGIAQEELPCDMYLLKCIKCHEVH